MSAQLQSIYAALYRAFGPQHWWPADSPFEVVVGAILTQNTNWQNVEKAIVNLKGAGALDIDSIDRMTNSQLETLIRPSGYFRQKAARLKAFCRFLAREYHGSLDELFRLPLDVLRERLLEQPGIGPETADSIILYAADKPSFVVDAYTHRILARIGIESEKTTYDQTRDLFMNTLPADSRMYNEYHALIVRLAKEHCRKSTPLCAACPLCRLCEYGQNRSGD